MFYLTLKTGEVFIVSFTQREHDREANGFPKETLFTLRDKYPNGKNKKRKGYLRTTAVVENVHEPNTPPWIGELVYDIDDFYENGGKLTPLIKELGRRKALLKALHSNHEAGGFSRDEIKDFIAEFEDYEWEQRVQHLLPQLEKEITQLLRCYGRVGGDFLFLIKLFSHNRE